MFDVAEPDDLVAEIESMHRQESVLVARRMAAVAGLLRRRVARPNEPSIGGATR